MADIVGMKFTALSTALEKVLPLAMIDTVDRRCGRGAVIRRLVSVLLLRVLWIVDSANLAMTRPP